MILVLSLPDAHERRENFKANFESKSNKNFVFFDGIYGKNLSKDFINEVYDSNKAIRYIGRDLTSGEIGATLSHYKMYKYALDNKVDYLVCLEDDTFIDNDFDLILDSIISSKEIPLADQTIFFLQEHTLNNNVIFSKKKISLKEGFDIKRLLGSSQYFVGSYGYLVSKNMLNSLVRNYIPFFFVCDHWYFVKKKCDIKNMYCIDKAIVKTNEESIRQVDSYINEERKLLIKKSSLSVIARSKIASKRIVLRAIDRDIE